MSALLYLLRRSLANSIRQLTKKIPALIGYVVLLLILLGSLAAAIFMPSNMIASRSDELFRGIIGAVIAALFYFVLKQGVEKGSSYFRQADVNLVFTGPFSSNKVLIYGFIRQLMSSLLVAAFLIYQIPNIKNNFALKSYGIWIILLAAILYMMIYPIMGMILYSWTSKKTGRDKIVKRILDGAMVALGTGFFLNLYVERNFSSALTAWFDSKWFSYVPLVGWLKNIASSAVDGLNPAFYLSLLCTLLFIGISLYVLIHLNLDYYEDVLEATESKEKKLLAKKQGRNSAGLDMKKIRNIKGSIGGSGAEAIFEKHMLEYRKNGYFLFIDKSTFFVVLFGAAYKFVFSDASIFVTLFFAVYIMFFFIVQGRWAQELDKPYIFLIPDSNRKKMLYATMTGHIKNLLDGALLFTAAGFLYKAPLLVALLCVPCYVFFGAVYIYGDVVSRRLFGSVGSKPLMMFLKLFVSFGIVLPGVVAFLLIVTITQNQVLAALAIDIWTLTAALGMFFAAQGIFQHIEVD